MSFQTGGKSYFSKYQSVTNQATNTTPSDNTFLNPFKTYIIFNKKHTVTGVVSPLEKISVGL